MRVLTTDELLTPKKDINTRPADVATAWSKSRVLKRVSNGWGHQWRCDDCNRGQIRCNGCNGNGATKCNYCDYNGSQTCTPCYGKKFLIGDLSSDYMRCSGCQGKGENPCSVCYSSGGPGKARCRSCNGHGTVNCGSCGATGGFTILGSVEFELRATSRTVLSVGCPPRAKGVGDRPLKELAMADGSKVHLRRLEGTSGNIDALIEFNITILEAEVPIKNTSQTAWTLTTSNTGFGRHNNFLANCLNLPERGGKPPLAECEKVLEEAQDTRVGRGLLRLAVEKGLDKDSDGTSGKAAIVSVLDETDQRFIRAEDLIPWRDSLRHAYATIPAEIVYRSWRKVLPALLFLALLLPLVTSPYAPCEVHWGISYEYWIKQSLVLLICLFWVLVANQGVSATSLARLREVVPVATADPPQNDWPLRAKMFTILIWLASTVALNYLPNWLSGVAGTHASPVRPVSSGQPAQPRALPPSPSSARQSQSLTTPRPSLSDGLFSQPVAFPGSEIYSLETHAWNENQSIPYRTQVLLRHLGLLDVVLDGKDNAPTRDALARLERMVGGSDEAIRQIERLYPGASFANLQQQQFLIVKSALLGALDFKQPPSGSNLRYLPPVLRLRQGSDGVKAMQNLIDLRVRGVRGVDVTGSPARPGEEPIWHAGIPNNMVTVRVDVPVYGLRRDAAGCFQALLRIEYQAGKSAMPAQTMKVCPEDMRRL